MSQATIRKVCFFFNNTILQPRFKKLGSTTDLDSMEPKQLVRTFQVGQEIGGTSLIVSKIQETINGSVKGRIFNIFVKTKGGDKEKIWKSYIPNVSDCEVEYEF